jgi:hypothetical protein
MVDASRLRELAQVDDPAWQLIEQLLEKSPLTWKLVEASLQSRESALLSIDVTAQSFLGGLAYNCGAILIDHGWVRLLGAGAEGLPSLQVSMFESNEQGVAFEGILAAFDILGGQFVIHGSGLDVAPGEICYWSPDSLSWEPLGFGHSALVRFLLSDNLADFYASLRWSGWEAESDAVPLDKGIFAWPPPFTKEGRDLGKSTRNVVPLAELFAL